MKQTMVLLLHSAGGSYQAALRRARQIQRGAEVLYPSLCFDRVLGRTPDDDPTTLAAPTTQRLVDHAARRISGQGGLLDAEPVGAVWVVSEITPDVEDQVTLAARSGLSVRVLGPEAVEWLLGLGERAEALAMERAEARDDGDEREFRSPGAVLAAYFGGAERVLGMRALPVARLCRSGGNAHGRRSQIELAGLRLSLAAGIVHRAMASPHWRDQMLVILRVAYAADGTMAQAAQAAGLGVDDAARRRASRLRARAVELVGDALAQTQAQCGPEKKCLTQ